MINLRFAATRVAIAAMMAMGISLSWATDSRATSLPQGTLIYNQDSVTLANSGEIPLDISALLFVRDDQAGPTRFEAYSWQTDTLAPGECVQLRSYGIGRAVPGICQRLVRWLATAREDTYFWQKQAGVDQFRVVNGSEDVTACKIADGKCTFMLDVLTRVQDLSFTYNLDSLYIANDGITPAPVERLRICTLSATGDIVAPCGRIFEADTILDPGGCVKFGPPVAIFESGCTAVNPVEFTSSFWAEDFGVISPVTARMTTCLAASADHPQRCDVPR